MLRPVILLSALFLPALAHAADLVLELGHTVETLDDGPVDLESVTFLGCDGVSSHVDSVNAEVDLVDTWSTPVPAGSWCAVRIATDGDALASGVNGSGAFTIAVDLDGQELGLPSDTAQVPGTVVVGFVGSGNPDVSVRIE